MHRAPGRRQRRRTIRLILFLLVGAGLMVVLVRLSLARSSAEREISELEQIRDRLHDTVTRVDAGREQASDDTRVVLSSLSACREADDIPDLGGDHVVMHQEGIRQVCLYVPGGAHTLAVSTAWKPTYRSQADADAANADSAPAGDKTWHVPLKPASGYVWKAETERSGGPVRWELSGNHDDFATQSAELPLGPFSHRGSSWSASDLMRFPNEIEQLHGGMLKAADLSPQPMRLARFTLRGPIREQPYEIEIILKLQSDGPPCVAAEDAQRLITFGQEDLLLPYRGGGKYRIRTTGTNGEG